MELTQEQVLGYYNKHKIKDNGVNSYTCPYYENKDYIICKNRCYSLIQLYIKISNTLYILKEDTKYDKNIENDTYETKVIEYKLIYKYVILSSIKNKYIKIHNMITISDIIPRERIKPRGLLSDYIPKGLSSDYIPKELSSSFSLRNDEYSKIIEYIKNMDNEQLENDQIIQTITKEKQTLKKDLINLMEELTKEKDKIIQQLKVENDQLKNQQNKILSYFT